MFADLPEQELAGDLSTKVLPVLQCPLLAPTVSPAALFTTPPDLSSKHCNWQTQPAGERLVWSTRNQNPKDRDAKQWPCSNVAAVLPCRGSSCQKLRVSSQCAVCHEQRP
jgi:hypothetical protein